MLIFRKMNSISSRLVPIRIRKKRRFVRRFLFDHGNGRIIHQFSLAPSPKNATFKPPDPLLSLKNATFKPPDPLLSPKNATFQPPDPLLSPKNATFRLPEPSRCRPNTLPFRLPGPLLSPKNATFRLPEPSRCRSNTLPLSRRILCCRPKTLPLDCQNPLAVAQKCNLSAAGSSTVAQKHYL